MASAPRPRAVPRSPRPRQPVDEGALQAMEARLAAEEVAPPTSPVPTISRSPIASLQARELASSQARQGTVAKPHVRRDGQATRGTTVHFPVEVHQQVRMTAAAMDRRISDIVSEAVVDWLKRNPA